jgi:coiled-coil domain-containing protein 39
MLGQALQVIRQQELLYNVEFQLQQMERRVARAKGERSDEETVLLNERINVLTEELEGVNAVHSMLLAQVKKAEDELEHANSANSRHSQERERVQADMGALGLEAEMLGRSVKKATVERQGQLVDLDVRKLEVQHLREVLNKHADEVFTLENKKFQLEQSLKERRHEIMVHKCELRVFVFVCAGGERGRCAAG